MSDRYVESRRWVFVCLVRSRVKGLLVLVRPVRETKQAGLCLSGTKSREEESLSSSVRYEESIRLDIIHLVRSCSKDKHVLVRPVRSCTKGMLVFIHPVRGIKPIGLQASIKKSCERRACSRLAGMRNQASETTSIQ